MRDKTLAMICRNGNVIIFLTVNVYAETVLKVDFFFFLFPLDVIIIFSSNENPATDNSSFDQTIFVCFVKFKYCRTISFSRTSGAPNRPN